MECKVNSLANSALFIDRINRNIVECKVVSTRFGIMHNLVLIETLWNVKHNITIIMPIIYRINRNIVECKVYRNY